MKAGVPQRLARAAVITIIVVVILGALAYRRILYYSAGPVGEKDCPPINATGNNGRPLTQGAYPTSVSWEQKGGTVNDSSCLDRTQVYGIVDVRTDADVQSALTFASNHGLKVSIAGVRHSQGGQAFARDAIMLDMRNYNQVMVDENAMTMTVGAGATWHQIQTVLHPKYAVKAMQSTDIFSVGGSISVNAHGMDHQAGSVYDTLQSVRVMLPDGTIKTASRTENTDLFRHVVGGYGLFGIILDATLDITPNVIYESKRQVIQYQDFPTVWADIEANKDIGLFYSHLSTARSSFLKEMILYTYTKTDVDPLTSPPLEEVPSVKLRRLTINLSKLGSIPMEIKWFTEKYVESKIETCEISRNAAQASGEGCLVSRNEPMHDSVPYLKNNLKNDTDILHEYFVPRSELISYIDGMRRVFLNDHTNLLNASIRVLHKEDVVLNYAPEDMFSIVLYVNQTTDEAGNTRMKKLTQDMIDLTLAHRGHFFLPYQLYYTKEQLKLSYPNIEDFFATKRRYDPNEMLTNTWYEKYGKQIAS